MTRPAAYAAALVLATASLLGAVPAALACSCAPPPDAQSAYDASALVLEGRMTTGPTEVNGMHHYTFDVVRSFKGDPGGSVLVETRTTGAACGRVFDKTVETYLIYAGKFEDGKASDNMCSRTRSMERGAEDIAVFGPGTVPGGDKPKSPLLDIPNTKNPPAEGSTDAGITAAPEGDAADAPAEGDAAAEGDAPAEGDAAAEAEPAEAAAEPAPEPEPEPEPEPAAEPADAGGDEVKDGCSMAGGGAAPLLPLMLLLGVVRRRA